MFALCLYNILHQNSSIVIRVSEATRSDVRIIIKIYKYEYNMYITPDKRNSII